MLFPLGCLCALAQVLALLASATPPSLAALQVLGASSKALLAGSLLTSQLAGAAHVLNPAYLLGVCAYLALALLGDVQLADTGSVQSVRVLPGLLCHLLAGLALLYALAAPTAPRVLGGGRLDLFGRVRDVSRVGAPMLRALQVPLHACSRGAPVLLPALAAVAAVGAQLSPGDRPRFSAVGALVMLYALVLHRALARLGYLAPLVTAEDLLQASWERRRLLAWSGGGGGGGASDGASGSAAASSAAAAAAAAAAASASASAPAAAAGSDSPTSPLNPAAAASGPASASSPGGAPQLPSAATAGLEAEERGRQWRAVCGLLCAAAALAAACSYRLAWQGDTPPVGAHRARAPQAAAAALSFLASALLAGSTPRGLPRQQRTPLSLEDAAVCPLPTQGQRLRVLIALPSSEAGSWDVAEAAVPWFQLTRRGHSVTFAVRDSGSGSAVLARRLPAPAPASVWGFFPLCWGPLEPTLAEGLAGGSATAAAAAAAAAASSAELLSPSSSRRSAQRRSSARRRGSAGGAAQPSGSLLAGLAACLPCGRGWGRALCPSSLACGPWEWRGWGGLGGPLLAALATDMARSAEFQAPITLEEALGARDSRAGSGASSSGANSASASSGASDSTAAPPPPPLPLPAFDGLILLGVRGEAACGALGGAWSECPHLRALVRSFWAAGQPTAAFGSAALVAAGCRDARGGALLRGRRSAAPSSQGLLLQALCLGLSRCRWGPWAALLRAVRGGRSGEEVVARAVGARSGGGGSGAQPHRALVALAWRWLGSGRGCEGLPGFRPPRPLQDEAAVLAQEGHYVTAQCGGDAFALSRVFIEKLEGSSRTF